ncbi:hypothetical protein K7432_009198 [Basidiobolus ranarum]|uniref:Uncharacterized protein n=1 Tax=Basidiobolus ranarum TaxID=34480 RepID=A0ABR2WQM3_9FUNG
MAAKLPDLNELFNPLPTSNEKFRYSTDFTRELIAEFDTQRRKMHKELEAQRIALESGNRSSKELEDTESIEEDITEDSEKNCPKSMSPVKERKGGYKFKTLRKNILHMWRSHEVSSKEETANMRRAKTWNAKETPENLRTNGEKKAKFSTWKSFPFATCTEDTTVDS